MDSTVWQSGVWADGVWAEGVWENDNEASVISIEGSVTGQSETTGSLTVSNELENNPTLMTMVNNLRREIENPSGRWCDFNRAVKTHRALARLSRAAPQLFPPQFLAEDEPDPANYPDPNCS